MKQKLMKLCVMMIALMLCIAISCHAAEAVIVTKFSDVPEEFWSYQTIMKMTEVGIFRGATEPVNGIGTFLPDKVMTRAEFITASVRAIYPDETKSMVNDQTLWWKSYYTFALQKGILSRTELEGGNLDKPMTREEMAMIMVRCVEKNGETLTGRIESTRIPDYAQIGNYYKAYVLDCFSLGLLCGIDPSGTFAPTKSLTRAEAATVLCRLIDKTMRVNIEISETPSSPGTDAPQTPEDELLPWENGGKQPSEYTLAEFQALSSVQKDAFIKSFKSSEAFDKWLNSVTPSPNTPGDVKLPWENGGKQPSEYTWAEFQALSALEKDAFIKSFSSAEAFNSWVSSVQPNSNAPDDTKLPWENGGKQPSEYTWAEFQALSALEKDAFIKSFDSPAAFESWMSSVQQSSNAPDDTKLPWENGGKQPSEYTWAEFQALSALQKDAFIESFGSTEAFNSWLNSVQGSQNDTKLPWENGGKQPSQYTWAEFQALSALQKDAFIASFGSPEAFNSWLSSVQGSQNDTNLPWENGGKQPSQYTWAEFQELSALQKDAFIESFGSPEAFNSWLSSVQGSQNDTDLPWKNGGKQPSEYTWAEFQALPDLQKDAFIESFGSSENFAEWLNANKP